MANESNQGRGFARMSESKRKHPAKQSSESQRKDDTPTIFTQNNEKAAAPAKAGTSK